MPAMQTASMKIADQLQFSVLSAPLAQVDRRALSQAWYSALYGSERTCQSSAGGAAAAASTTLEQHGQSIAVQTRRAEPAAPTPHPRAGTPAKIATSGNPPERRAPHSPLAKSIERAVSKRRAQRRGAAFSIGTDAGRVRILVRSTGGRVRIFAVCAPRVKERVAAALAQARYALSSRGIDLSC